MPTLFITHPACLNHLTPPGHPERPDRLRAIERAFESERFQDLARALKSGDKEALLYEVITRGTVEEFTSNRRRQHSAYGGE